MNLTQAQKAQMIATLASTPEGRKTIAAELIQPLREYQDYEAVGRTAFLMDSLPASGRPIYDKDVNASAYIMGERGQTVITQAKGDSIFVPLFEVISNPEIPMTQIQDRRYDIKTRVQVKAKAEVFRAEDRKIFALMKATIDAPNAKNAPLIKASADVTIDDFSEAMGLIERHGLLRCRNIYMNPSNMKYIRKLGSDYFEPALTGELLKTGFIGALMGAQVHTSPEIPVGEIYFTAEPEFTGVFVESIPLTVMSADVPNRLIVGFVIYQRIGVAVTNSHSVACLKIS